MIEQKKPVVDAISLEGLDGVFDQKQADAQRSNSASVIDRPAQKDSAREAKIAPPKEREQEAEKEKKAESDKKTRKESKKDGKREKSKDEKRKSELEKEKKKEKKKQLKKEELKKKEIVKLPNREAGEQPEDTAAPAIEKEEAESWIKKMITGPNHNIEKKKEKNKRTGDFTGRTQTRTKNYALPVPEEPSNSSLSSRIAQSLDVARKAAAKPIVSGLAELESRYKVQVQSLQDALHSLHARICGLEREIKERDAKLYEQGLVALEYQNCIQEMVDQEGRYRRQIQNYEASSRKQHERERDYEAQLQWYQMQLLSQQTQLFDHEHTIKNYEDRLHDNELILQEQARQKAQYEQQLEEEVRRVRELAQRELEYIERERKSEEKICLLEAKVAALETTLTSNKVLRQRVAELEQDLAIARRSWWKKFLGIM